MREDYRLNAITVKYLDKGVSYAVLYDDGKCYILGECIDEVIRRMRWFLYENCYLCYRPLIDSFLSHKYADIQSIVDKYQEYNFYDICGWHISYWANPLPIAKSNNKMLY